jgi:hypothetical protein
MSLQRKDYIQRLIEQLAETLASVSGLRKTGKKDEAALLLKTTEDGLFGPMRSILETVDAKSAAGLLGDPSRIRAYAAIVAEKGEMESDERKARALYRRALDLYAHAPDEARMQELRDKLSSFPPAR